ncbi:Acg family FMN-binding oxidoreductase [Nonomuraea bangladeshensis]|uniref:Acg family FMN-binding oxidoreductase n=1 Tax=Nonomuraea bangladeshensis TaxID=404385 RepID=UPI003C2D4D68
MTDSGAGGRRARAATLEPPFASAADVCAVVGAAAAAPSVHNTQPWRFHRADDATMELYADLDRLLTVTDPMGRGLGLSCGAALYNLRLAVRVTGHDARVRILPDPAHRPDLLATVHAVPGEPPTPDEQLLHDMIPHRRTNRFPFDDRPVPREIVVALVHAAHAESATLVPVSGRTARRVLELIAMADDTLADDPAYRDELARWTGPDTRADGVPEHAAGPRPRDGRLPMRDFGRHAGTAEFEPEPQLAALFTRGDGPRDWLRAGQALQRVLLTATARGVAASLFSQPLDLRPPQHRGDRTGGPFGHVQMLIRLGYGPPVPRVPRRPVAEVLDGREARGA